jgi:hypothetical protein
MGSKKPPHTCCFTFEQTSEGYFPGSLVCSICGEKISQSQWIETIAKTSFFPVASPHSSEEDFIAMRDGRVLH